MKSIKKTLALLLATIMVLALGITTFAQDVDIKAAGKGTITISNAAKGETYSIYKLFDATVTGTENGSIAYTGTIPAALSDYFSQDTAGYISAKDAAWKNPGAETKEMSDGLRDALKAWAKTATATATEVSDGSTLNINGLDYGYYVVTTTQGEDALISVDSTNPSASIYDKNSTTPTNLTKAVDDDDVNIGDTVTYTVQFKTSNYDGTGEAAKKIVSYTIADTLPSFLKDVVVDSIIVDNDGNAATTDDQIFIVNMNGAVPQFENKAIDIKWYDNNQFLYKNGATIIMTYHAVVTEEAAIDGDGNTNKVTVTWALDDGSTSDPEKLEDEKTIYTYAIALKKIDDKGVALSGATFQLPFYVKETPDADDSAYIYAGTTAEDGLTDELTTPASGEIVVKGVESGKEYSITEIAAPNGYNKLADPVKVTATQMGETTTHKTFYLDENGDVTDMKTETTVQYDNDSISTAVILVVNKTGAELPTTGGMGTTLFYIIGGIMVIGAAVLLITKRRMRSEK